MYLPVNQDFKDNIFSSMNYMICKYELLLIGIPGASIYLSIYLLTDLLIFIRCGPCMGSTLAFSSWAIKTGSFPHLCQSVGLFNNNAPTSPTGARSKHYYLTVMSHFAAVTDAVIKPPCLCESVFRRCVITHRETQCFSFFFSYTPWYFSKICFECRTGVCWFLFFSEPCVLTQKRAKINCFWRISFLYVCNQCVYLFVECNDRLILMPKWMN